MTATVAGAMMIAEEATVIDVTIVVIITVQVAADMMIEMEATGKSAFVGHGLIHWWTSFIFKNRDSYSSRRTGDPYEGRSRRDDYSYDKYDKQDKYADYDYDRRR